MCDSVLCSTIASVGKRGKENDSLQGSGSLSGTLERGRSGRSSLAGTMDRKEAASSSFSSSFMGKESSSSSFLGKESSSSSFLGMAGSLSDKAGSRGGTLERRAGERSALASLGELGSPGLLNSLPRGAGGAGGGAGGLARSLRSPSGERRPSLGSRPPSRGEVVRSPSVEGRRSVVGEGEWLSESRRGGSPVGEQEGEDYGDLTKARTFWKDLDNETVRRQSQDHGSRRESKDFGGSRSESKDFAGSRRESKDLGGSRRESKDFGGSRRESKDFVGSKSERKDVTSVSSSRRESKDTSSLKKERKQEDFVSLMAQEDRSRSREPQPDYDMEMAVERQGRSKSKSSGVRRAEPVAKRRRDSQQSSTGQSSLAGALAILDQRAVSPATSPVAWQDKGRRGSSAGREQDYDRGRRNSTDLATLERRGREERDLQGRAGTLSRKGSNAATLAKRRENNPDESQHFLSLQLFNAHAEPSLDEYLPLATQLELEHKQREEEDGLYRKFIQERREQEDVVGGMGEEEREELFDQMNKMERSRIINLADKHCAQMLDLIHR